MPLVVPFQPLLTFKFLIYFVDEGDDPVLGMTKMGALKQKTQNVAFRTGGHAWNSASQIPGGVEYEAVTFEQGLGLDDGRFEGWALAANNWKDGQAGHQPEAFRKNLRVDVMNTQGEVKLSYILADCWVSEYQALPELDANNLNTVGISSFTVQLEGWRRAA
jgi:phage tail-like protein